MLPQPKTMSIIPQPNLWEVPSPFIVHPLYPPLGLNHINRNPERSGKCQNFRMPAPLGRLLHLPHVFVKRAFQEGLKLISMRTHVVGTPLPRKPIALQVSPSFL